MLNSIDYGELRNGKPYLTSDESEMSHHGSTEEIANRNSSENVVGENPEMQTLTQEAVDEQITAFIAPLNRQLEELTRLVQEMSTSRHQNSYPRTDFSTTSGTAMPQSDNRIKLRKIRKSAEISSIGSFFDCDKTIPIFW